VPGTILVLGAERLLVRETIDALLREHRDLEVVRLTGDSTTLAGALDEVRTRDLLGGAKAVVLLDADPLVADSAELEALAQYAGRPSPAGLLIVHLTRLDGRLKAAKALRSAAEVREAAPPAIWKLPDWVQGRAQRSHGLRIDRAAAQALVARLGEDLGRIDNELERFAVQLAPRTSIVLEDVTGSTEQQRSPAAYEAANALEEGDLEAALTAIGSGFGEGVKSRSGTVTDARGVAPMMLGALHSSWVKLLRFHLGLQAGLSEAEAAKRIGVSPKATRFFLPRAKRHRLARLVERHTAFLQADRALKTSQASGRQVLESLVVRLLG
jgi:DNA polymerase-3 subunit delta